MLELCLYSEITTEIYNVIFLSSQSRVFYQYGKSVCQLTSDMCLQNNRLMVFSVFLSIVSNSRFGNFNLVLNRKAGAVGIAGNTHHV